MDYKENIWLLVGREVDGRHTKNYIFMNYSGRTQFIQKRSVIKFCREHDVLNVQTSGDSIIGKGINIIALPKYVKQQGFGLQQVGGMQQGEVQRIAQPLINQYIQKKENEIQRNNIDIQKDKQNEYVLIRLNIIENLLDIALAMKDITNELASNGKFTRYLRQIDIDNAEGDTLTSLIQRQGINGLASGLESRIDRLNNRVIKYNLDKSYKEKIKELKSKCETIKKLHQDTKQIIKDNKRQEEEQEILLRKQFTEVEDIQNIDYIPVVDNDTEDIIAIDESSISVDKEFDIPVVDDIGDEAIELEQCDLVKIENINDISKQGEHSEEEKELQDKINELCELYSKAVTNIESIIHNPKKIAEIAHDLDMEFPGVHKKLAKDAINSNYNSEEEITQAISEHYDYITAEEHRGSIWRELLNKHLGKVGDKIYGLAFKAIKYPDDNELNKYIELFDYYMDTLIKAIVNKLNEDKESCIQKSLQNFTKISTANRKKRLNAIIELKNVFSNEIVYQAFFRSNMYKHLTTYEKEVGLLEDKFYNGEFTVSYNENISIKFSESMDINEIHNITKRFNDKYNQLKYEINNIKKFFKGSAFDLKDNPYHPADFIHYMYCIHGNEIDNQTESMCNNGGWDFVTARNNARHNIINSYYTDNNTKTYYDLCNELIKNFYNIHGGT